jgi:hypothetical protein
MSLPDLLTRFEDRFYQWAVLDSRREIEQGFPFLRRVADRISMRVIAVMTSLAREQQFRLGSCLVRANRVRIASDSPIAWTPEDDEIHAWYRQGVGQPTRDELALDMAGLIAIRECDKKQLMRAVNRELGPLHSDSPAKHEDGDLRYRTSLHGFDLETVVLRGKKTWQLSYYHRIKHVPLGFDVMWISLYSWLGITSMTNWSLITDATIPQAAAALRDLCSHFIKAADNLLDGLVE